MPSLYGVTISTAILACLFAATKIFPNRKDMWDIGLYCVTGGILGARIYHVLDYWKYYSENPLNMLMFWNGGLGIWGAIIGGALGILTYSFLYKKAFMEIADTVATVVPLGQAIGRWGNFFNSELAGKDTKLPWNINGKHPLFFYEYVLDLLLFLVLVFLAKKRIHTGHLFAAYLAGYGTIRFFLEFFRIDPWKIGFLNVSQTASILSIVISFCILKKTQKT